MPKVTKKDLVPDWIFESSWEVCNRVGGIYTVLSTHAKAMMNVYGDCLCFIGPDIPSVGGRNELFSQENTPLDAWRDEAMEFDDLKIRTGRWNIPGRPMVVLVDYRAYFAELNRIFSELWMWFGVDSLHAYGDYNESVAFAYACGKVIRSFCRYNDKFAPAPAKKPKASLEAVPSGIVTKKKNIIAHFHEWTTGVGLLYCKKFLPQVATVFTTHATSIGRSICGNGKQLYDYMEGYNGDQMAAELNMQSKHSVEKIAAHQADCFTTVSGITAKECTQLLEKTPDVITPNGFEDDFLLPADKAEKMHKKARKKLIEVAEALFGYKMPKDTLLVATSGRYEYHNKGLDAFIDSMHRLQQNDKLKRNVLAYILVPGNVSAPRQEVIDHLKKNPYTGPIYYPYNTHWMYDIENDRILNAIKSHGFKNSKEEKVKIVFVPCYLHGDDGIFNMNYYDLLQGFDLTAFLSYYEPWGYTPLESIAFSIPTMTTTLSGFGAWCLSGIKNSEESPEVSMGYAHPHYVQRIKGMEESHEDMKDHESPANDFGNLKSVGSLKSAKSLAQAVADKNPDRGLREENDISEGVAVIPRRDGNYNEVVEKAAEIYLQYSLKSPEACREAAFHAEMVSKRALWRHFIVYYEETYNFALQKEQGRIQ